MNEEYSKYLAEILGKIDKELKPNHHNNEEVSFAYSKQREIISNVFGDSDNPNCPTPYNINMIIVRLRLIDSFYSAGGRYGYLTVESLAQAIYNELGDSEVNAADWFYDFVSNPGSQGKVSKLFKVTYGIQKNLKHGTRQISLLSKYVFFQLLKYGVQKYPLGFPIFDSMATETYPKICKRLGIEAKTDIHNMTTYIEAFKDLLGNVQEKSGYQFENQAFDVLDQYLWRIGKMENGSYSLLLDQGDYGTFIKNIGMEEKSLKDFNKCVVKQCKSNGMDATTGINNKLFKALYEHWLSYFSK